MAMTPSNMLPLGTKAPDFNLVDAISDQAFSLNDLKSEVATVIMFICNHCPFVIYIQDALVRLANEYIPKGVSFVAINSNDPVSYPADDFNHMKEHAEQHHYPFPYLFDESQEVAKAYQAACTPDFYIFDRELRCVYRGQFDDSRPGNNKPITGKDIIDALDNLLADKAPDTNQKPSQGCNIKWRSNYSHLDRNG